MHPTPARCSYIVFLREIQAAPCPICRLAVVFEAERRVEVVRFGGNGRRAEDLISHRGGGAVEQVVKMHGEVMNVRSKVVEVLKCQELKALWTSAIHSPM